MKVKYMRACLTFVCFPLLSVGAIGLHQAQPGLIKPLPLLKWKTSQSESVDYTIGRRDQMEKPKKLSLYISVSPESFVREKMRQLAERLNRDFLSEPRVVATILDDARAAQNLRPAGADFPLFDQLERGQYYLDRAKGYEYIVFSTRRGRPANEVVVNLGPNRPKWLKTNKSRTSTRRIK